MACKMQTIIGGRPTPTGVRVAGLNRDLPLPGARDEAGLAIVLAGGVL